MKKLKALLVVVGIVQLALGVSYLLAPDALLRWMGHSAVAADIAYPFGMLAARFLVYGALLLAAARSPAENRLLIAGMIWIQAIDLGVGAYYTLHGTVGLSLSAFPMFNATVIAALLAMWLPARRQETRTR